MKVTLLEYTPNARELLIFTKRTRLSMSAESYADVFKMSDEEKLEELTYMANTIPSSWEFVDYTFMIEGVSRGFTHQFVRTRTGSYAQQSMRVTDMSTFGFVTGPSIKKNIQLNNEYHMMMYNIDNAYRHLIDNGAEIEDARGVLPTNICTNIVAKHNLRTMHDLARSRTGGRTQGEYREVVSAMCDEILRVHPWAEVFLFPKERGFFEELEENVARVEDKSVRQDILKSIDKMRKSL